MKEAKSGAGAGRGVRTAGAATFTWKDGAWTDTRIRPGMKTLKVKYLSDAYFALLRLRPRLKEALALGERVRVLAAEGRVIEVAPDGISEAAKVEAFLR
ncbi:MAG: hypothetical protein D6729_18140 [Deltaproteobacteria bacterium]|nr:MAG: hypothetical protein D6729_18140 [Deltaproteobacteria bacterium]